LLAIDHDPAPRQLDEVDPVPAAVELEVDAAVNEALPVHARAQPARAQELDRAVFEHTGSDTAFDVVAAPALENDRPDAGSRAQVREQETGGPRADHADLGPGQGRAVSRRRRIASR